LSAGNDHLAVLFAVGQFSKRPLRCESACQQVSIDRIGFVILQSS
jgi:hypothetical protein